MSLDHIHKFREGSKLTECGKPTTRLQGDRWAMVTCQSCLRSLARQHRFTASQYPTKKEATK